jgi:hypothetical protein
LAESPISLVGRISLVSFSGLVDHSGLVGFIGIGLSSLIGFLSLFGQIGLVGCIGHNSLAGVIRLSLVSLVGLSVYWPFKLATHEVAIKLTSATKISNAAIWYYCAASHWFMRESWFWLVILPNGRLNSVFFRDVLQNAKQLFCFRLPQMTKYCIMRECENIHSWISLSGDLAFSHHDGMYGFKFPRRFLEIFFRDLTLFSILIILRPDYQSIGAPSFCICKAECLASSSQTFSQL